MRDLQQRLKIRILIQSHHTSLQNGYQQIDKIIYFEDPNEADFGTTPEDFILGDFAN